MQKKSNSLGLIIGAVVLTILCLAIVFQSGAPVGSNSSYVPVLDKEDWTLGNKDSDVIVYEFSDMQCPACAQYHEQIMKPLIAKYSDRVLFVFRHFPLEGLHKNAIKAAIALEAAGKQNNFFEMQDLLFTRQSEWSESEDVNTIFIVYAKELGLDEAIFQTDIDSLELAAKINPIYKILSEKGFEYTPTFYLNDKKLENSGNLEDFEKILDKELN